MSSVLASLLLPVLILSPAPQRTRQATDRIHPFLAERMAQCDPGDRLPVYFVMTERLSRRDLESALGTPGSTPGQSRIRRGSGPGAPGRPGRGAVVGRLREHMRSSQRPLIERVAAMPSAEARVVHRNYLGNFLVAEMTPDAIRAAAGTDGVQRVWFDRALPAHLTEDSAPLPDGVVPGNGPLDTRASEVWAKGIDGTGVVWMNADSGVRASHTDPSSIHPGLAGRLWNNPGEIFNNGIDDDANGYVDDYYGWSFASNDNVLEDNGGHGSQTAGVFIARDGNTELGNSPGVRIMTARINSETSQWAAIQYAIDNGAHGMTSSHSYKNDFNPPPNYALHRDVGEASLAAGLIRTNSTSNNGGSCSSFSALAIPFNISAPGCLPAPWLHPDQTLEGGLGGVLGIGAHHVGTDTIYGYSPCGPFAWNLPDLLWSRTYGLPWDSADNDYPWTGGTQMGLLKPDLTGPQGTLTVSGTSGFAPFGGTSNATPGVASCLALALSANPSLTPADLTMAAQTSAVDLGAPGKDNRWGAGKVDAWELTKLARNVLRVNGSVAHTVRVSVADDGVLSVELDGLAGASLWLARGSAREEQRTGELVVRVRSPRVFTSGSTDAGGDFTWSVPLTPAMIGAEAYLQVALRDSDFGPFTGSNAIRVVIEP